MLSHTARPSHRLRACRHPRLYGRIGGATEDAVGVGVFRVKVGALSGGLRSVSAPLAVCRATLQAMTTSPALALVPALIAAIIAVVVPLVSFRLALRQDHSRWLREQREELYVDLLT